MSRIHPTKEALMAGADDTAIQEHLRECLWCRDSLSLWQFIEYGRRKYRVMVEYNRPLDFLMAKWQWPRALQCNLEGILEQQGYPALERALTHSYRYPDCRPQNLVLVPILRDMSDEEAVKELAAKKLRPAVVHELLTFGHIFKDVQPVWSYVVARGTVCAYGDESYVFTLHRYRESNLLSALCLDPIPHRWHAPQDKGRYSPRPFSWFFLGVPV